MSTLVSGARPAPPAQRSIILNLLVAVRPNQWTKNFIIFAALIFGERLFEPIAVAHAVPLTDRPLLGCVGLWALLVVLIIYW